MANKQINELTEKTTIVDADLIPIYDSEEAGSEKTKKITFANAIGYEEGTWTPVPADAASGGNTGSAATATGTYVKVGRLVTVNFNLTNVDTTGLTGGNGFYIQGLPFSSQSTTSMSYCGTARVAEVTFSGYITTNLASGGNTSFYLANNISGSSSIPLTVSALTDDIADIRGQIIYEV